MTGRRSQPPSPARAAEIRAVLTLDLEREDELILERAREIAAECAVLPPLREVPALARELVRLEEAFEGHCGVEPEPLAGPGLEARAVRARARRFVELVAACRRR